MTERRAILYLLRELHRFVDFFEIDRAEFLETEDQVRFVPQRYLDECRGIAEAVGVEYKEIVALNFSGVLSRTFRSGCTSFVVPRSHTDDGSMLLLKNRDLGFRRIHPQLLAYSHLQGFNKMLGVTTAGNIVWYQGVNDKGLVVFNNNSPCEAVDPPKAQGVPVGVVIRRVLEECSVVEDALKFIQTTRHSVCSNVFIADPDRAVIVEVKAGLEPFVWEIDKPSCRANHYLLHTNPEPKNVDEILTRNSSFTRYETGKALLKDKTKVGLDDLMRISRDHSQGPSNNSICRHAPLVGTPMSKLTASVTLSGQIFSVGRKIETYTALGRPCQVDYVKVAFGEQVPEPLASGTIWLENHKTSNATNRTRQGGGLESRGSGIHMELPDTGSQGLAYDGAMPGFEILEDEATADIGIRSYGKNLEEAFANMAIGMFSVMTDVSGIALRVKRSFKVSGKDLAELLYTFLEEFLFIRDVENLVFGRIEISIDQPTLTAQVVCLGDHFDPNKHVQKTEIKAVTYHRMEIKQEEQLWTAKVVFDI